MELDVYAGPRQFWSLMVETRVNIYYASELQARAYRLNWKLSVALAIATSASVAAWSIWKTAPWLWAVIVGGAQLTSVIRPYLPFERRAERLFRLAQDYEDIALFCEDRWFHISRGTLDDGQIHELLMEVKRRRRRSFDSHADQNPFPSDGDSQRSAKAKAKRYFAANFGV